MIEGDFGRTGNCAPGSMINYVFEDLDESLEGKFLERQDIQMPSKF